MTERWGLQMSGDGGEGTQYWLVRDGGDPGSCVTAADDLRALRKKLSAAFDTQDSHENLPHEVLGGKAGHAFRHGARASKQTIWDLHNKVLSAETALRQLSGDMKHVDQMLRDVRRSAPDGTVSHHVLTNSIYLAGLSGDPDFQVKMNDAIEQWSRADGYWYLAQLSFYTTMTLLADSFPPYPNTGHAAPPADITLPHGGGWRAPDMPGNLPFNGHRHQPGDPSPSGDPGEPTGGDPAGNHSTGGGGGGGTPTGHGSDPGGGHPAVKHHEPQLTPEQRHLLREQIHEQRQEVRRLQHQIDALEKDAPEPGDPAAAAYHAQIRTLQSQIQLRHDQIATLEHQLHPHAGDHHPGHQHGHGGGRGHLEAAAHFEQIPVGDGTEDAQDLTDPLAPVETPAPEAASVPPTDDPAAASSGDDAGTPEATSAIPTPGLATDPTGPTAGATGEATSEATSDATSDAVPDATVTDPVAADGRRADEANATTTQAPTRARLAARLGGADQV
ncbi:hypothetical protein AB3X52_04915 [Nocardioides sp. DS6]|uniref:Uncharacterized protein n=1 Tax=Nocardioides eburneus TaxID=3231482 RepID=A0ABV3SVK6_9ACTN